MRHIATRRFPRVVLLIALFACAGTQQEVDKQTQLLTAGSADEQRAAVDSLAAIGPPARSALPALFATPLPPEGNMMDLASRMLAVEKILSVSDEKAMAAVSIILREGSGITFTMGTTTLDVGRILAGNALGKKGAAAVPILREALASTDAEVRRTAANALAEIGSDAAAAIPALQALASDTSDRRSHEAIMKAIAAISTRR